jgi:hypothetical protein
MAGLVAAFIFAVQMLNFPVAAGTSGHLLGGTLAAILVGPYTAVLCVAVVLLVQGFFFADGGLTALGINISLMGIVAILVGWFVFRLITRAMQVRRRGGLLRRRPGLGARRGDGVQPAVLDRRHRAHRRRHGRVGHGRGARAHRHR